MALTLTLDLDNLTFGQLATFVDAARWAGVKDEAQFIMDDDELSLIIPEKTARAATATAQAEPADQEHTAQPFTPPQPPVDPMKIADALRTMAAAEPTIARIFEGLRGTGQPPTAR